MAVARVFVAACLCWIGAQAAQMTFTSLARGDLSRIEEPRTVVVRTPAEWAELWKAHAGEDRPPSVDLARFMVVGVFAGSRPTAGFDVEITRIEKRDKEIVVTWKERRPPPDAMVAQMLTAPFHIARTESAAGPIRFQRAR
jgi:hypothetical protein